MKRGEPWFIREDWTPYIDWVEPRLILPGRWAVIPDAPGAPSQLNDSLLNLRGWDRTKWAPLWHMDGPVNRLLALCDRFDRVCLGWTGTGADSEVGCEAWWRRMDEVAAALGNLWPHLHHNLIAAHDRCNGDKGDRMPTGCELIWLAVANAGLGIRL